MSASRRKATKRRDNDPVRVFKDGQIAYWTGGRPGAGVRKWDRRTPGGEAEERALELHRAPAKLPGQDHVPSGLLRLSAGCEHVEDLWADVYIALAARTGLGVR